MTASPPWWLRVGRRLFPAYVWDGAGVVVDKSYREPYTGETLVAVGRGMDYGSGTVEERWVLVVRDNTGEEHYLNVEKPIWDSHEIGDWISADDPLVNLP